MYRVNSLHVTRTDQVRSLSTHLDDLRRWSRGAEARPFFHELSPLFGKVRSQVAPLHAANLVCETRLNDFRIVSGSFLAESFKRGPHPMHRERLVAFHPLQSSQHNDI